jgi:hypothetical protein
MLKLPKYAVLVVITAVCVSAVSCSPGPEAPSTSASFATPSMDEHLESPAAPIGKLATGGRHCFHSPLDVAAAAARIEAFYARAMEDYEAARRAANAGGSLPAAGANIIGEVSDPDPNNCLTVSTYPYGDRYWFPFPESPPTPTR